MKSYTIIHFSDWEGDFVRLPWADLYICTGNMLPNFPVFRRDKEGNRTGKRQILRERESYLQGLCIRSQGKDNNFRKAYLGNEDAPVVCVRGSLDFVPLKKLFGENCWELGHLPNEVLEIDGLRITGFRGVPYRYGELNDEFWPCDLNRRVNMLPPDIDILVTHAPPAGVKDRSSRRADEEQMGIRTLASYAQKQLMIGGSLRLHCFGYCRSSFGIAVREKLTFSNAATGYGSYLWDGNKMHRMQVTRMERNMYRKRRG